MNSRRLLPILLSLTVFPSAALLRADQPQVETIVCVRHGEKPKDGIGNLDPQGLNRALALPEVLARYGKPAFIFAPDPAADMVSEGQPVASGTVRSSVSYVRPLLTIGPTAIRLGMPINTPFGFKHIADLEAELDKPEYAGALVFIAWEHHQGEQFMKNEVKDHGGNVDDVKPWQRDDFDSIYVAKITRAANGAVSVNFQIDHEGLNGLSTEYPKVDAPR